MENINRAIGQRIREIRKRLKLKGEELGQILGVSKGTVSAYERGEAKVSPEYLIRLAELGGVTLDWLVAGEERCGQVREETTPYAGEARALDGRLLTETIQATETMLSELGMASRITPADKARVIKELYAMALQQEGRIQPAAVRAMLRLVGK